MERREFLNMLAMAGAVIGANGCATSKRPESQDIYAARSFGQVRLMHFTDCHAQLLPTYYREPNVNLGFGSAYAKPPHLVGDALLEYADIPADSRFAYAFTHLDFVEAARRYGKVGGFSHLQTLVSRLRAEVDSCRTRRLLCHRLPARR